MTVSNVRIFGLPDLLALPSSYAGAGSQASASMSAANLVTQEPSEFWRSTGYTPGESYIYGYNQKPLIDGNLLYFSTASVGVASHNLWPQTGEYRVVLCGGGGPIAPSDVRQFLVPTSTVSSTNVTGNHTAVDEGFGASDSSVITPTNIALPWDITMGFDTPVTGVQDGNHKCAFYVKMRSSNDIEPTNGVQTIITVYDGATIVRQVIKNICRSAGQWVYVSFSKSELTDTTGAGVRIKIDSTPGTEYSECISVVWDCETEGALISHVNFAGVAGEWTPVGNHIGIPITGAADYLVPDLVEGETFTWTHTESIGSTAYVVVWFREDHSPNLGTYQLTALSFVPPGYIQVGKLLAGTLPFEAEVNFENAGVIDSYQNLSTYRRTKGGQTYGSRQGTYRVFRLPLNMLKQSEQAWLKDRILRRRGAHGPVAVSLAPGDPLEESMLTMYANVRVEESQPEWHAGDVYKRALTLVFEEKL